MVLISELDIKTVYGKKKIGNADLLAYNQKAAEKVREETPWNSQTRGPRLGTLDRREEEITLARSRPTSWAEGGKKAEAVSEDAD